MTSTANQVTQAALVIDIVESSRLYELDADAAIERWRGLVARIQSGELAPPGALVRSTGDGVLLAFDTVRAAITTAFAIQAACAQGNTSAPDDQHMLLRMGIEIDRFIVDENDIYGRGAMLATRLMSLAGPGEVIVSARVRDFLTAQLDADVEDLGECYLKHLREPVRAYRVGPPGSRPRVEHGFALGALFPTMAVVPLAERDSANADGALGEIIAEELIGALSRSTELNVISRLSTTALRNRSDAVAEAGRLLKANYVLSGTCVSDGKRLNLRLELAECRASQVVWSDRISGSVGDLLSEDQPLIAEIVLAVSAAVMSHETRVVRSVPLPNLGSYTLLLGAISLMHRLTPRDFEEAQRLLESLLERATRQAVPHAWMAMWHVLRVQQGWSNDPVREGHLALDCTKRALDNDPDSSLALAIDGQVHTNLLRDLDAAEDRYDRAIGLNASEALAWLLRGTLHAFRGDGSQAVADTQRALALTPLDPRRYFYESLAATACMADRQYEQAAKLAASSLRANRTHTSTLRVLSAAQWHLGRHDEARATARELMALEPSLTVSGWLARSPSADYPIGAQWADVLRQIGVPA